MTAPRSASPPLPADPAAAPPAAQRLLRDIAGHNLSAARDALAQLAEFERSRSRPSSA